MDLGAARRRMLDSNFTLLPGCVDVVVERPYPDDTEIEARGVWMTFQPEDVPVGAEFSRKNPRRIMALRKSEVPTVPKGTVIWASEAPEGPLRGWRVDGIERSEADQHRVVVVFDECLTT